MRQNKRANRSNIYMTYICMDFEQLAYFFFFMKFKKQSYNTRT